MIGVLGPLGVVDTIVQCSFQGLLVREGLTVLKIRARIEDVMSMKGSSSRNLLLPLNKGYCPPEVDKEALGFSVQATPSFFRVVLLRFFATREQVGPSPNKGPPSIAQKHTSNCAQWPLIHIHICIYILLNNTSQTVEAHTLPRLP